MSTAVPWSLGSALEHRQSEAKAHWSLGTAGGSGPTSWACRQGGHTPPKPQQSACPRRHLALLQTRPRDTHDCHVSRACRRGLSGAWLKWGPSSLCSAPRAHGLVSHLRRQTSRHQALAPLALEAQTACKASIPGGGARRARGAREGRDKDRRGWGAPPGAASLSGQQTACCPTARLPTVAGRYGFTARETEAEAAPAAGLECTEEARAPCYGLLLVSRAGKQVKGREHLFCSQGQSSFLLRDLIPPTGQLLLSFSCKQNLTLGDK